MFRKAVTEPHFHAIDERSARYEAGENEHYRLSRSSGIPQPKGHASTAFWRIDCTQRTVMLKATKKKALFPVLALVAIILSPWAANAVCRSKMPAANCCAGRCPGATMPGGQTGTNNCCTVGKGVPLLPALVPASTKAHVPDDANLAGGGLPFLLRLAVGEPVFPRLDTFLQRVRRTEDLPTLICAFLL